MYISEVNLRDIYSHADLFMPTIQALVILISCSRLITDNDIWRSYLIVNLCPVLLYIYHVTLYALTLYPSRGRAYNRKVLAVDCWISFTRKKSTFFNISVAESDLDSKAWIMAVTFNNCVENELSMRCSRWNVTDYSGPCLRYDRIRNVPRFCMDTICDKNLLFQIVFQPRWGNNHHVCVLSF